jgi:hypothetical protein
MIAFESAVDPQNTAVKAAMPVSVVELGELRVSRAAGGSNQSKTKNYRARIAFKWLVKNDSVGDLFSRLRPRCVQLPIEIIFLLVSSDT